MAGKGSHYVKPKQEATFLTKKDVKWLIGIGIAIVVAIIAITIGIKIADDSLVVKNGKLDGVEPGWIVANSGDKSAVKYLKYGEYDFSDYDGEVVPGCLSFDEYATSGELFPSDGRYASGYVYATSKEAEFIVQNVTWQIGSILTNGTVYPYEEFEDGFIYWYTATEERIIDEEAELSETVYVQTFSAYLPADHDGCMIARVNYEFDSADKYVDAETGYAEVRELVKGLKY